MPLTYNLRFSNYTLRNLYTRIECLLIKIAKNPLIRRLSKKP